MGIAVSNRVGCKRKYKLFFMLGLFSAIADSVYASSLEFKGVYPFVSFKKVIDTCMRAYSDLLVLEERTAHSEYTDEQVDLLVGRLVRLKSYCDQLIHEYRHEATVSHDDLVYVVRVLEYMEITADHLPAESVAVKLNGVIEQLKQMLTNAL